MIKINRLAWRNKHALGETTFKSHRYVTAHCMGCKHVEGSICDVYLFPSIFFRYGRICPMASHIEERKYYKVEKRVRVGQQKQRKKK